MKGGIFKGAGLTKKGQLRVRGKEDVVGLTDNETMIRQGREKNGKRIKLSCVQTGIDNTQGVS